jgi:hypothetical protein
MAAASTKTATDSATNSHASPRETIPRGSSRLAVRGFLASIAWSTRRLKPIAALRAATIATTIQNTWPPVAAPP